MTDRFADLRRRIDDGSARLAVVGLGYVGTPVACRFAEAGFQVLGLDVAAAKVDAVNAGRVPFEGDTLGRLSLTKDGLRQRDRLVLEGCRTRRLPIAIALGGGYARDIEDTVDVHLNTLRHALASWDGTPELAGSHLPGGD